jgi:hypothetical protein
MDQILPSPSLTIHHHSHYGPDYAIPSLTINDQVLAHTQIIVSLQLLRCICLSVEVCLHNPFKGKLVQLFTFVRVCVQQQILRGFADGMVGGCRVRRRHCPRLQLRVDDPYEVPHVDSRTSLSLYFMSASCYVVPSKCFACAWRERVLKFASVPCAGVGDYYHRRSDFLRTLAALLL